MQVIICKFGMFTKYKVLRKEAGSLMEFEDLGCLCARLYLHRNYVLMLFAMCVFHCLPKFDTVLIKGEHESHEYMQNQNITGNSTEQ